MTTCVTVGRHDVLEPASTLGGRMTDQRNIFISHKHSDDDDVKGLIALLSSHGMEVRNGSITSEKFNQGTNEQYIKNEILRPRIQWASTLVVVVSEQTKDSDYVNWEIEVAAEMGKRIVAVWEHGASGVELPQAAQDYADATVGWNGDRIIDAIEGEDAAEAPDGKPLPNGYLVRQPKC